jgi:methanogenic corrinoid protein MtbC1
MAESNLYTELISAISDLQEGPALHLVRRRLADDDDPIMIIEDCREGMRRVGERYEAGEYFLAGLIMAGEIFRQVMEMLQPVFEQQISGQTTGQVLLGTVQGDIHDLGKNIVNVLLSCHNFVVHDLGVDVPPDLFAEQARDLQPDLVGLSGLLTSSYDSMRETIAHIREGGYQGPIIIGGGQITEEVCQYVEADYWSIDAVSGVELCQRLMTEQSKET